MERKDKELVDTKKLIKTKLDDLEKENEQVKRVNKSLADQIKYLNEKVSNLKNVIRNCSKMENLDTEKVKNLKKIGEGGFGQVFRGEYKGHMIAMKVMKLHWTSIKEMLIQAKMNSPNLMRASVYGLNWNMDNLSKSEIILGMELCDTSIHNLIRKTQVDRDRKLEIIRGTSSAVQQLHSIPVIHMDIKPENFLLKGNVVKLSDFGLSDFGSTGEGKAGTPGYIAPEVILSKSQYSNKCDMWSLGATIYEILLGRRLVSRKRLRENPQFEYHLCTNINSEWDKIGEDFKNHITVLKELLVKDPHKRMNAEICSSKIGRITVQKK